MKRFDQINSLSLSSRFYWFNDYIGKKLAVPNVDDVVTPLVKLWSTYA